MNIKEIDEMFHTKTYKVSWKDDPKNFKPPRDLRKWIATLWGVCGYSGRVCQRIDIKDSRPVFLPDDVIVSDRGACEIAKTCLDLDCEHNRANTKQRR